MSTQYLFVAAIRAALYEIQSAKLQVQTQIMDQSLAVILQQLCYGIIRFIVLFPGSAAFSSRCDRAQEMESGWDKNSSIPFFLKL